MEQSGVLFIAHALEEFCCFSVVYPRVMRNAWAEAGINPGASRTNRRVSAAAELQAVCGHRWKLPQEMKFRRPLGQGPERPAPKRGRRPLSPLRARWAYCARCLGLEIQPGSARLVAGV